MDDRDKETREPILCLSITLDLRMGFEKYIRKAVDKANATTAALSRLMTNIGGPGENHRLLMSVTRTPGTMG